jgi:3-hydroxybutyryl-CoA dehydrogenase
MKIAIIGAGTMGHGLALVYALGGHQVALTDTRAETLAGAPGLIEAACRSLAEAGEVAPDWHAAHGAAAINCVPDLAATVAGADLVIEAITEQPEAKRALYATLDKLLSASAVLASNTSYLDVFPLIPPVRQARALIMHWYTPPYLVDLVDIVPGPQTSPDVIAAMRQLVLNLGKVPIIFHHFISGYVANRIQSAIALEVYRLLDDGVVSAADIDNSVIHGLALRMPVLGVLAKADFTGLPLQRDALANRTYAPPPVRGQCDTIDRLLAAGNAGVMSGRGFFDWQGRTPEELFRERDRRLLALKRAFRDVGPLQGRETSQAAKILAGAKGSEQ